MIECGHKNNMQIAIHSIDDKIMYMAVEVINDKKISPPFEDGFIFL